MNVDDILAGISSDDDDEEEEKSEEKSDHKDDVDVEDVDEEETPDGDAEEEGIQKKEDEKSEKESSESKGYEICSPSEGKSERRVEGNEDENTDSNRSAGGEKPQEEVPEVDEEDTGLLFDGEELQIAASQSEPVPSDEAAIEETPEPEKKEEAKAQRNRGGDAQRRDSLLLETDDALFSKEARRQYQDDSKLRTSLDGDEITFDNREIVRHNKQTMLNTQAFNSFNAANDQKIKNEQAKIFADNLGNGQMGVDESPLKPDDGITSDSKEEEESESEEEESKNSEDLLADIMNEDSDESSSDEKSKNESGQESDSGGKNQAKDSSDDSIQDLTNKSIDSGPSELQAVVDPQNYLPFISDKFDLKNDVLEVIDRNERSFKIVAEKMIQKSSQLDLPCTADDFRGQNSNGGVQNNSQSTSTTRRLMHFKLFDKIANRFHGDVKVAQGVPYSIAALEDFIAIGSSDGSVRLFDSNHEQELKVIIAKDVKNVAVTCLDLKRVKGSNLLHIVAGYAKSQVALYEVKGLPKFERKTLMNVISFRHLKTVSDTHMGQIIQVKFYGDFKQQARSVSVVSCDINGIVYLSRYTENVLGYTCNKQCFWKKRLNGPAYVIAPLFYDFDRNARPPPGESPYGHGKSAAQQALEEDDNAESRIHLIAFGALERVVLTQVSQRPCELLAIERPDYIDPQIVPYLDWGEGLSPVYRDRTYPILAIAWGRTVQLAIWTNRDDVGAPPEVKLDGFYICDGFSIDQCFFLDESLLFVLINKKEVRILYTQNFTPGMFDDKILNKRTADSDPVTNKKYFMQIKQKFTGLVSTYAEVDKGYRLLQKEEIRHKDIIAVSQNQLRSKFNFHPTVCKNFDGVVVALGKSTVCQGKLIHWEEYLDLIRRTHPDDWLKVLRAALDIFSGKIVGLAGLPDQREAREHQLRERMKDLLRENIDACIKEFQEGQMVQSKTLRVATEFCIKVGAIDHLFGELFNMFAEAGIEQRYFENLEAFILSGRLKQIQIPHRILTRIIQYYRQKDVELLEKSILNLNLNNYPNNLEVRHICEEEFLSSALINMLMTIFDRDRNMENTVCLHILCALYNLMKKSRIEKTKEDVMAILTQLKDSTILFEANQLDEKTEIGNQEERKVEKERQQAERQQKLDIEHSTTYIGYKLMWVIRLFLLGKKFPTGTLSSFKWRMYVFDIVRFITTPQFLKWFLQFDALCFFKLIQPLFLDNEPFQYITTQRGFVEMYRDEVAGLEECASHNDILNAIHKEVKEILEVDKAANDGQMSSKCEVLENAYMFFISKISMRSSVIKVDDELYQSTIIKQLKFHRKLLKMDLNLEDLISAQKAQGMKLTRDISKAIATQMFLQKPEQLKNVNKKDRPQLLYKHLVKKNEKDVLNMIKAIQDKVDEDVIKEFSKEADHCPMYMIRVYLHQILQNYQKCLTMFFRIKIIKANVFAWLQEIQANIMMRNDEDGVFEQMQQLILKNIGSFIEMDSQSTVVLCDQWFSGDYYQMVQAICSYSTSASSVNELCFNFINKVLELKQQTIMEEYMQTVVRGANDVGPSDKYKQLIIKLVEILCEKKYRKIAMEYVQRDYFPIDECLAICEERGVIDACAVLYKRKSEYKKSISLYVQVLTKLSKEEVIFAVYINANIPFNDPNTENTDIKRFDELMTMIIEICDKYGSRLLKEEESEELWLFAINEVYKIKQDIMEEDEFKNLDERDLNNFQTFLLTRIQAFMMRMAEYVKLEKIINFLHQIGQQNTYSEFQPTFEEKVKRETYHENILNNATDLIQKDMAADANILTHARLQGVVARKNTCDKCDQDFIINRTIRQDIQMFKCGHNFHTLCLKTKQPVKPGQTPSEGLNCLLCFNEYDHIQQIIQSRAKQNKGVGVRGNQRGQAHSKASTTDSDDGSKRDDEGRPEDNTGSLSQSSSHSPYQEQEISQFEIFEKKHLQFEYAMGQRAMFLQHYM